MYYRKLGGQQNTFQIQLSILSTTIQSPYLVNKFEDTPKPHFAKFILYIFSNFPLHNY